MPGRRPARSIYEIDLGDHGLFQLNELWISSPTKKSPWTHLQTCQKHGRKPGFKQVFEQVWFNGIWPLSCEQLYSDCKKQLSQTQLHDLPFKFYQWSWLFAYSTIYKFCVFLYLYVLCTLVLQLVVLMMFFDSNGWWFCCCLCIFIPLTSCSLLSNTHCLSVFEVLIYKYSANE